MPKSATKLKPPANGKPAGACARTPAPEAPDVTYRHSESGRLKLSEIKPCPFNVRRTFAPADIAGLAESIRATGLKEPLLVRPVPLAGGVVHLGRQGWMSECDHFELVDGERRFRALALIGGDAPVAVIVRDYTDEEVRAIMLVSREQSRDLSASELVVGYSELRATQSDDAAVAALVGKPVGHVRSVLRLAKLPGWAMVAVDAGLLPRATAELVARVPGEESRKLAAGCVLQGAIGPSLLIGTADHPDLRGPDLAPLSYRDTKKLIADHFTKELKGAPFGRKELYVMPGCEPGHERYFPSCDECPKRAGNDPEAQVEGTRADVCLDPDCYRTKVAAYRAKEVAKAAVKGIEEADLGLLVGYSGGPPRGWCDVSQLVGGTELSDDLKGHKRGGEKLRDLLAKPPVDCAQYIAFGPGGKSVLLVKTAEARKSLQHAGVLKRPEPRPKAAKREPGTIEPTASAEARRVSAWETDGKACDLATDVLRQYTESECSALDDHEDSHEDGPIRVALELVCRAVCYEFSTAREGEKALRAWVVPDGDFDTGLDAAICAMRPSQMIGLLTAVSAQWELRDGPYRPTGKGLLAFAELDWPALQEQARRVLAGGESAEAKIAAAKPIVHCDKCKATYDATDRDRCPSCGLVTAAEKVTDSPTPAPAGTSLAAVPKFPPAAVEQLALHGITTVEQLRAEVAKLQAQPKSTHATVYTVLRELNVTGDAYLDAGDAIIDLGATGDSQFTAPTEPAAKPAKSKSKKAGAR